VPPKPPRTRSKPLITEAERRLSSILVLTFGNPNYCSQKCNGESRVILTRLLQISSIKTNFKHSSLANSNPNTPRTFILPKDIEEGTISNVYNQIGIKPKAQRHLLTEWDTHVSQTPNSSSLIVCPYACIIILQSLVISSIFPFVSFEYKLRISTMQ